MSRKPKKVLEAEKMAGIDSSAIPESDSAKFNQEYEFEKFEEQGQTYVEKTKKGRGRPRKSGDPTKAPYAIQKETRSGARRTNADMYAQLEDNVKEAFVNLKNSNRPHERSAIFLEFCDSMLERYLEMAIRTEFCELLINKQDEITVEDKVFACEQVVKIFKNIRPASKLRIMEILNINKSTYYGVLRRKDAPRTVKYAEHRALMRQAWIESNGKIGIRRYEELLKEANIPLNTRTIIKLRDEEGLR